MERLCDLHVHSIFSDGTCSPAELIDLAEVAGLSAIALCDHNTVAGLPDFMTAAQRRNVEAVPGIEFSTDYEGTELHILALYVRPEYYDEITALLADADRRKEESNIALAGALNEAGYIFDYEAVKAATPRGHINRAHIAAELTRLGYTESVQAAFKTLLSPEHGYYNPPKRMNAYDAIRYIKSIGAVAVLAHPFLSMDEAMLRAFLPEAARCGLDAMETMYAKYDEATTDLAMRIAQEHGILNSGGSDFHGKNKPDIAIGIGRGTLRIPAAWLQLLRERIKNAKK